ncbi:acyltransferase [Allofournierella massiliensis]|uniref:acyltransferase n=1 Tax=Allofournierella massiliensis TaxID=1650663 RepID=UPI00241EFCD5|nr:acyltransferase [Fournierella massiliensis]
MKRINYFGAQGDGCYFQPYNFGTEPELIYFGNNVVLDSQVMFINHDITSTLFNKMENVNKYKKRTGAIHIGNNVFIGARSMILYDVKIGNNVIVGAGSLVNRDIPDGSVVAGIPARVIGRFDEYKEKIYSKDF